MSKTITSNCKAGGRFSKADFIYLVSNIEFPRGSPNGLRIKVACQAAPNQRLSFADAGSMNPRLSIEPRAPTKRTTRDVAIPALR